MEAEDLPLTKRPKVVLMGPLPTVLVCASPWYKVPTSVYTEDLTLGHTPSLERRMWVLVEITVLTVTTSQGQDKAAHFCNS